MLEHPFPTDPKGIFMLLVFVLICPWFELLSDSQLLKLTCIFNYSINLKMVAHKAEFIYIYEGPKWHSDFMVLDIWWSEKNNRLEDPRELFFWFIYFNFFLPEVPLLFKIKNKKIEELETGHVFPHSPNFLGYTKKCGNQAAQFLRKYLGPGQLGSVVKALAYGLKGHRMDS